MRRHLLTGWGRIGVWRSSLDYGDFSAHVSQHHPRAGTGANARQFNNFDTREWSLGH
jgi:hypothetical protein